MNIVQLHERTRFWLDMVKSTRFDSQDIDNGLNIAIDMKVRESYDQNRPMNKSDSFQRNQRLRDELGPIVAEAVDGNPASFTLAGNVISIASSSDYRYLVSLGIKIGSVVYDCFPLTYDRKNTNPNNPYRRARMTPTVKMYYNELGGNIVVTHAYTGALTDFELYYIKNPATVNYGIEYTSAHAFTPGDILIAVEQTVYAGVTYKIGDEILIAAPNNNITSGVVVHSYVNTDLRASTHEEIARRAAINLLISNAQVEKVKLMREEITAS